jgi:hypothetical protein
MPSRGLQAIRGNAPRLYQQQCRNVIISRHAQSAITTTNNTRSSHRELSPEPRLSSLPLLAAQSPRRNGGYEAPALPSPSPPSAMPPPSRPRPLLALHQHPRRLSLSPPPLPRPLLLPPLTTSIQSPSTMSRSPPPTTWSRASLKDLDS